MPSPRDADASAPTAGCYSAGEAAVVSLMGKLFGSRPTVAPKHIATHDEFVEHVLQRPEAVFRIADDDCVTVTARIFCH